MPRTARARRRAAPQIRGIVRTMRHAIAVAAALALALPAAAAAVDVSDIAVKVRKEGETIHVSVDCPVKASPAVAWEVMTDYENMAGFITNLTQDDISRALEAAGDAQPEPGPTPAGAGSTIALVVVLLFILGGLVLWYTQ